MKPPLSSSDPARINLAQSRRGAPHTLSARSALFTPFLQILPTVARRAALDRHRAPTTEDQAADRAHRTGTDRPVTVLRLLAQATVEEQVAALHRDKRQLARTIHPRGLTADRARTDAPA